MKKEQISAVMAEFAKRGRNNLKKKLGKKGFSLYMGRIGKGEKLTKDSNNVVTEKSG